MNANKKLFFHPCYKDPLQGYNFELKIETPQGSEHYSFASKTIKGLMKQIAKTNGFKVNKNQISFDAKHK